MTLCILLPIADNYNNKGKHCLYKPGSVSSPKGRHLSFIYSASHPTALAFYPPSFTRTGNPQTMVYANLQPPDGTAQRSPVDWWSLTPPSHPCLREAVIFFFHIQPSPTASTFRSGVPYAARTFLSCPFPPPDGEKQLTPATGRDTVFRLQR